MAVVVRNTVDEIVFCDKSAVDDSAAAPTLSVILGDWEQTSGLTAGALFEITGDTFPLLTGSDIRKLAKWLVDAANCIEGVAAVKKPHKRAHYEQDDDPAADYGVRYKK